MHARGVLAGYPMRTVARGSRHRPATYKSCVFRAIVLKIRTAEGGLKSVAMRNGAFARHRSTARIFLLLVHFEAAVLV